MARLHWRLTGIRLDEDENVANVTAIVDDQALDVIRGLLADMPAGGVHVLDDARGGTEFTVSLDAPYMRTLFSKAGKIPGAADPRYACTSDIYDSLSAVIYGLIGEDD